MRILWLEKATENPWIEKDAWTYLESSDIEVTKCKLPIEARELLEKNPYDIVVVCAEVEGGIRLLEEIKCHSVWSKKFKVIVVSAKWTDKDFADHSKMFIAADKYLRLPLEKIKFVQMLKEFLDQPGEGSRLDELFPSVEEGNNFQDISGLSISEVPSSEVKNEALPLAAVQNQDLEEQNTGPVFVSTPILPPLAKDEKDSELIRKYLHMREEELALVLGQKQELSRENHRLQKELNFRQVKLRELEHSYEEMSAKVIQLEKSYTEIERALHTEKEIHEVDNKSNLEKNKYLETQISTANDRYEELKNRVRKDIRKIRIKERDLEAKLEIARRDTETLLSSRDKRILELQRKIDALEFDLDQVQDNRIQAESEAERYLAKLSRVARALHLAINMIEDNNAPQEEEEEIEPVLGGAALSSDEENSDGPVDGPVSLTDDLAALANDGETTNVQDDMDADHSQVIADDSSEKAIG